MKNRLFVLFLIVYICSISVFSSDLSDDYLDLEMYGEGLTVVSTKPSSQQIRTVSKDELDSFVKNELSDILSKKGNLSVNNYGGYGNKSSINIRGFTGSRDFILIDG